MRYRTRYDLCITKGRRGIMAHIEIIDGKKVVVPCTPSKIIMRLEDPKESFKAFERLVCTPDVEQNIRVEKSLRCGLIKLAYKF
jgi:hypothetical protein